MAIQKSLVNVLSKCQTRKQFHKEVDKNNLVINDVFSVWLDVVFGKTELPKQHPNSLKAIGQKPK